MFAPVIIARLIAKAKGGVFGGSSRGACTWVAAPPAFWMYGTRGVMNNRKAVSADPIQFSVETKLMFSGFFIVPQ